MCRSMRRNYPSVIPWGTNPHNEPEEENNPMLVLSRKPKESIVINGNVTVSVLRVDNDNVRIGIEAPMEVPVMREEIYNEISKNNQAAAGSADAKLKIKQLVNN